MKTYISIGHFKGEKNITAVALKQNTLKDFKSNLAGNEFIGYVSMTKERFETLTEMDSFDIFQEVKKMTSNYRKWNDVTDYIYQCSDIIRDRAERA